MTGLPAVALLQDLHRMIGKTDHWRGWVGEGPSDDEVRALLDEAIAAVHRCAGEPFISGTADESDEPLTPEEQAALDKAPACVHCGGWHGRACPRVRRLAYHSNGQLAEVEFWPHKRWSETGILWPDTPTDPTPTP